MNLAILAETFDILRNIAVHCRGPVSTASIAGSVRAVAARNGLLIVTLAVSACGADESAPPSSGGANPGGSTNAANGSTGSPQAAATTASSGSGGTGGQLPAPTEGPLKGLPAQPGPHVAQIEALGDNEWLELPTPAGDPIHGLPCGRSWGNRALISVPDLRGAYFYGEGVHAYVKPDGYGMDDMWFYDLNGNRWITLHPGINTATFNSQVASGDLKLDGNQQLVDTTGQNVPVHLLIHAWSYLSYDPHRRELGWVGGRGLGEYYMPGLDLVKPGLDALEAQRAGMLPPPMSPWFYDVMTGRFARRPSNQDAPDVGGFPAFDYIPHLKEYLLAGAGGVAYFNPETNTWRTEQDQGPRPDTYDHGGAYDPVHRRLYTGRHAFHYYDLEEKLWVQPATTGPMPPDFSPAFVALHYDPPSQKLLAFENTNRLIYVFDPSALTWTTVPFEPTRNATHFFYDETLNAYFRYDASDSSNEDVSMWVYRYKQR